MTSMTHRIVVAVLAVAFAAHCAFATEPLAIQDNSFLIEEAYNQETNVVQHIFNFQRDHDGSWYSTFTQEWPVAGQTHQLSYTFLFQNIAHMNRGVGDLLLNYRFQLVGDGAARLAISPRASLIVPSGNRNEHLGGGGFGYDVNLPVSFVVSDRVVTHWNAGATQVPSSADRRILSAGASVIWAAWPDFHFIVESKWLHQNGTTYIVSPGVRWAHNLPHHLQVVPGIAMPIDTRTKQKSAFLYLSFEHPYR